LKVCGDLVRPLVGLCTSTPIIRNELLSRQFSGDVEKAELEEEGKGKERTFEAREDGPLIAQDCCQRRWYIECIVGGLRDFIDG